MFKNLILTLFLFFSSFLIIYPSKKEVTNLFDYCYSLEKLLSRNTLESPKNLSNKNKAFAKKITLLGINKTRGDLVKKIIDQYKNSKKSFILDSIPNQFYCLTGYWIEELNPGAFQSILYEKSKQKIDQYTHTKKEIDEFFKDINLEYRSIKKEINNLF